MILVAGATGLVGGMITKRLAEDGKRVRALVRPNSDRAKLESLGVETVVGDLKDPGSLDAACEGVEVVVTTANSASRGGDDTPETVEERGNCNLVAAARRANVRQFVFTSALGSNLNSPVPFMRGKAVAEQCLRESGVNHTILMPNLFMEIWFPNIVGGPIQAGRPVTLIGEGKRKHSMISVQDVAAFAAAAVGNESALNRTLVLGGPEAVSWLDVIAAYERHLGRPVEVRFVPMGEPLPGYPDFITGLMTGLETYDSVIDMQPVAQEFGVAQVTMDESIQRQLSPVPSQA